MGLFPASRIGLQWCVLLFRLYFNGIIVYGFAR